MFRKLLCALLCALLLCGITSYANAAITFIAETTADGTSTSVTPTEPTGTAQNDVVIAFCGATSGGIVITPPGDFTQIDQVQNATDGKTTYIGYKVRGATAGSGYSFSRNTSGAMRCTLNTYRGVDTTTPLDVTYVKASHYIEHSSDGGLGAAQPITTVTNGAWVVLAWYEYGDGSYTAGAPSGYTLRSDGQLSNRAVAIATKEIATAGVETPGVWTHTSIGPTNSSTDYTIALKPAGASLPTFTAGPTAGTITSTTIPVTFTSDTTGTVKGTACANGNAGNKAETLLGQCSGGGAAVATISEAVTATVPDGATFTGLSAGTTYDLGFVIDATTDSDLESLADQTTLAAPAFDTVMSCSSADSDTYTCTYDANASSDDIYVCVMKKDASAPANGAAVVTCSGGVATATEATTGSSDSISVDIPGGDPFPIYDIYGVLKEDGGAYSSVDEELDETLPAPTGRQYVTKSGSPGTGEKGLLDGASPAAVDGDIIDAPTHADSFALGPAVHTLAVNADTTFNIDADSDSSRHTFTRRFYDVSAAAWSDSSAVLYCVNNQKPAYQGPEDWEGELIYLFEKDASVSYLLDGDWDDPEGDDLTHNVNNLPSGLSEDGEEVSGTPDTFGYYTNVELEATDICEDSETETVQFVVGYRIPDIFAWLQTEESWRTRNIFEAIDADYVAAFGN